MAGERRINWGLDAADAKYRSEDTDPSGGDLVLAEDLDGGTVLLRWDDSAGEWVYGGPVNMGGEDLTNVGSITAEDLTLDPYHNETLDNESIDIDTSVSLNSPQKVVIDIDVGIDPAGDIDVTINDDTSLSYFEVLRDGATSTENTGQSAWTLNKDSPTVSTFVGRFVISQGDRPDSGDKTRIAIYGNGATGRDFSAVLVQGGIDDFDIDITSIQVSSTGTYQGRVTIRPPIGDEL